MKSISEACIIEVKSIDDGDHVKCPRCWQWHVIKDNYDRLCDRCQQVILKDFPDHESVPFIKEELMKQRIKYGKNKEVKC